MNLKIEDILDYLGYNDQVIDENLLEVITSCKEEVLRISNPRYTYEIYEIKTSSYVELLDTNVVLKGDSIKNHLENCSNIAMFACTLGIEVEKKIRFYEIMDLTRSLILDAAATALIENLCDEVEKKIKETYIKENLNYTLRFSPGYGDLDISLQKDMIRLLQGDKKIGINCTSEYILLPRKSVTALIGISKDEIKSEYNICDSCYARLSCIYRSNGKKCSKYR